MDDADQKILTALVAGTAAAATAAVKDAYAGLKKLITDRFKSKPDLKDAIDKVEQKPESAGRRATLEEEIALSGAATDPEIVAKAEVLLALAQREGCSIVVNFGAGAIASGNRSTAGGERAVVIGGNVYGDAFSREFGKQWRSVVREGDDE